MISIGADQSVDSVDNGPNHYIGTDERSAPAAEEEKPRRTKRVKIANLTDDGVWVEEEESVTCSEDEEVLKVAKPVVVWGLKDTTRDGKVAAEKEKIPESLPKIAAVQKVDDESSDEEVVAWGWMNKSKIGENDAKADANGEASTRAGSRHSHGHDSDVESEVPRRVAYFPKKLNGKVCLIPEGEHMWKALNYFLKANTAGLEFREAKSLDSKMDHVLTWGEAIEGSDEGDGWVRVQHPEDIQMEILLEESERLEVAAAAEDDDVAPDVVGKVKMPSEHEPGSFLMLLNDDPSDDDSSDGADQGGDRRSQSRSRSPIRHSTRAPAQPCAGLSSRTPKACAYCIAGCEKCGRNTGPRKMRGSVRLFLENKAEEEKDKGVQLPAGMTFTAEISPEENLAAQVLSRHVRMAPLGFSLAASGVKAYLEEKCRMLIVLQRHTDLPSFDAEIRRLISTKESDGSSQTAPKYAAGPLIAQNGMVNLPIPQIRFAHDAQREHFGHLAADDCNESRLSVLQLVVELLMGQTLPGQVPTFRVCRHEGQWYCHSGNRRLAAFQLAHHFAPERFRRLMVPIAVADDAFLHGKKQKLTTFRNGPDCLGRWMFICETGEPVGLTPAGQ
eukprot:CAMPEP_0169169200 /NCGR_PEP_ID=MMETSP1015-20121227/61402_1 /TAXON_ID=342587 /ORGANISM="Karlodinium micrum, Strain CCMP2283" /LENGTH=613 /DNA_ID=CAMNT_0009242009 /DNA_START=43 /DNA_END=1882 /DNA_ORIENTATION=+